MNASPFWSLVWKEYHAGWAFWLALGRMATARDDMNHRGAPAELSGRAPLNR
jgi:hypothetical protein